MYETHACMKVTAGIMGDKIRGEGGKKRLGLGRHQLKRTNPYHHNPSHLGRLNTYITKIQPRQSMDQNMYGPKHYKARKKIVAASIEA